MSKIFFFYTNFNHSTNKLQPKKKKTELKQLTLREREIAHQIVSIAIR